MRYLVLKFAARKSAIVRLPSRKPMVFMALAHQMQKPIAANMRCTVNSTYP